MRRNAAPSERIKRLRFYHGGKMMPAQARKAMTKGLQVPPDPSRKGPMAPVPGRTYLSSDVAYSGMYARPYLFVIPGENLVDVHVDEDSVGELTYKERFPWLNRLAREALFGVASQWPEPVTFAFDSVSELPDEVRIEFENRSGETAKDSDIAESDDLLFQLLYDWVEKHPDYDFFEYDDSDLYDQIMGGEYAAWAEGGKIVEPMLDDWQKIELLEAGAHVSHAGPVMPSECWELSGEALPKSYEDLAKLSKSCSLAANPGRPNPKIAKLKRRLMR